MRIESHANRLDPAAADELLGKTGRQREGAERCEKTRAKKSGGCGEPFAETDGVRSSGRENNRRFHVMRQSADLRRKRAVRQSGLRTGISTKPGRRCGNAGIAPEASAAFPPLLWKK